MLLGAVFMAAGLGLISTKPSFSGVLPIWFLIGVGWSLVQTPAGRVVNRSSSPADRFAYFSAQFALSHACWLIFYLVAGQFGTHFGVETTALVLGASTLVFAAVLWPKHDETDLTHIHAEKTHEHKHIHGLHHEHEHEGWEGPEPHSHPHRHQPVRHAHRYVIDDHHAIGYFTKSCGTYAAFLNGCWPTGLFPVQ